MGEAEELGLSVILVSNGLLSTRFSCFVPLVEGDGDLAGLGRLRVDLVLPVGLAASDLAATFFSTDLL